MGCATSKPWLSGRCGFTSDFFSWINGIVTPSTKAATHYCSNLRTWWYIAQQLQRYASIRYRIRIKACTNISEGTDQQFHGSDKICNIQSSCWRVQGRSKSRLTSKQWDLGLGLRWLLRLSLANTHTHTGKSRDQNNPENITAHVMSAISVWKDKSRKANYRHLLRTTSQYSNITVFEIAKFSHFV